MALHELSPMNVAPSNSPLLGWTWGWGDMGSSPKSSSPHHQRASVCESHLSTHSGPPQSSSQRNSITRLHPHQYLHVVGPGGRPCGGKGARRSSAPLLRDSPHSGLSSCSSGSGDLRVPFADSVGQLSYDPYGPYSDYGVYSSTSLGSSPKVSPRGSPRISPRSSPRKQSRVSRDLCLDDLVVVSVPCRERKVSTRHSCTMLPQPCCPSHVTTTMLPQP